MRTITSTFRKARRAERGGALLTSLIIMSLLAAVSMTVLAVVTHESRIAGSDLRRTQTFYAAAASSEKMTSDFSALFTKTSNPAQSQLDAVAAAYPSELVNEGFSFSKPDGSPNQSIVLDSAAPAGMVTIPSGAFSGLIASVKPYLIDTTARQTATGAEVHLQRRINNFLVPIFQFSMFSKGHRALSFAEHGDQRPRARQRNSLRQCQRNLDLPGKSDYRRRVRYQTYGAMERPGLQPCFSCRWARLTCRSLWVA
jgi:hypothetical protein